MNDQEWKAWAVMMLIMFAMGLVVGMVFMAAMIGA